MELVEILKAGAQYGPVMAFGLWLLYKYVKGDLVSLRQHEEQIARAERAEDALRDSRETIHELVKQNATLLSSNRLQSEVVAAIREAVQKTGREGDGR